MELSKIKSFSTTELAPERIHSVLLVMPLSLAETIAYHNQIA